MSFEVLSAFIENGNPERDKTSHRIHPEMRNTRNDMANWV